MTTTGVVNVPRGESLQNIEPTDLRHVQIEHETIRWMRRQRRQEIAPALIILDAKAVGGQQPPQRLAHLQLVINHGYGRIGSAHSAAFHPKDAKPRY